MAEFWIIRGAEEVSQRLEFLQEHLVEKGIWPIRLDVKKHINPRSLSHNALFWMWCETIAEAFNKSNPGKYDKELIHDLMCHRFLGYDVKEAAGETINVLRGTSKLNSGEFGYFMEQIDAWACDKGVLLTYPQASEYNEYKEAQNG